MRRFIGALVLLASCSSANSGATSALSPSVMSPEVSISPSAASSPSPTREPAGPVNVADFLAAITATDLPITDTLIYDRQTDPNGLLGRPHEYVAKAGWCDARTSERSGTPGWDCGGGIEVFKDLADVRKRWRYLGAFANAELVGGFYMWMSGTAIIRVGHALTRARAKEYGDFLASYFPATLRRYRGT